MKPSGMSMTMAFLAAASLLVFGACGNPVRSRTVRPARKSARKPARKPVLKPVLKPILKPVKPRPMVEAKLPLVGLKAMVPKGTRITASIIPNTDSIMLPGVISAFVVRRWQAGDKTLEKVIPWARGHRVQFHRGDVLIQGAGKIYTYIYKYELEGTGGAVLHKYVKVGNDVFRCFSNADTPAAAVLMAAICDTLKK